MMFLGTSKAFFATLAIVIMGTPITNRLPFFFSTDGMFFTWQPMLPHISVEAPAIRNQKSSIQLKEKISDMVKVCY